MAETSLGSGREDMSVNSGDGGRTVYGTENQPLVLESSGEKRKKQRYRFRKRLLLVILLVVLLVVVAVAVALPVTKYFRSHNQSSQPRKITASDAEQLTEAFVCGYQDRNQPFDNFTDPTVSPITIEIDQQVEQFRLQAEQLVQSMQEESIPYCDQFEPARLPVVGVLQTDIKASGSSADIDVTIPLSTPRGTGGHDPDLALKYSSNAGNSILGKGWGLAFLPTISRCPKKVIQNGYLQGITLTDKDAFCVGTDQLVLVRGQSANVMNYRGERYKTARDSRILYKAYGPRNGLGPTYWTAHLPNGIERVFGRTPDSRVLAPTGAVFVWQASSETDPFGNAIDISFEQSTDGSADWYRKEIRYAEGNAKVEFHYSSRPDPSEGYLSGVAVRTSKLLTSIQTYSVMPEEPEPFPLQSTSEMSFTSNSSGRFLPIFTYHFTYEQSPVSGRSLLSQVQLCDGCNGACQPPLTFSYDQGLGKRPLSETLQSTSMSVPSTWYYSADCSHGNGNVKVYYPTLTKKLTADVNGDSQADVIVASWSLQGFQIQTYLSKGDGTFQSPATETLIANTQSGQGFSAEFFSQFYSFVRLAVDDKHATFSVFMDDFSGDGIPDVSAVWIMDSKASNRPTLGGSQFYVATATARGLGGGQYAAIHYSYVDTTNLLAPYEATQCNSVLQDVNLDLELDLIVMCGASNQWRIMAALGDSNGLFHTGAGKISDVGALFGSDTGIPLLVQDLTGDGSPDLVAVYAGPKGIVSFVSKSEANGLYGPMVQQVLCSEDVGSVGNHSIQLANLGGGTVDLIVSKIDNAGWTVWVARSTGDGKFNPAVPHAVSTLPLGWGTEVAEQLILDMNGDTRDDLVAIRTPGKQQGGFYVYVVYSMPGNVGFSPVEQFGLLGSLGPVIDSDVNEPFAADVTGDGRVDIGAYHIHFYDCQNPGFYSKLFVAASQGASPLDKLTKVQNGFGSWTSLQYEPMTSSSVYSQTTAYGVPVASGMFINTGVTPRYLLQSVDHDDGLGGTSSVFHHYAGFSRQTRGYGNLGFAQITSTQSVTGMKQTTDFSQDFMNRHQNLPLRLRTFSASGTLLADQNNTWSVVNIQPQPGGSDAILAYTMIRQSQASNSESGQLVKTEMTEAVFDGYGNPTNTNYTATDPYGIYQRLTTTQYRNDETRWLIGFPEEITQESAVAWNEAPIGLLFDPREGQLRTDPSGRQWIVNRNKARRTFDHTKGFITSETLFADTAYEVTTKSTRDSHGNVIRVESVATGESTPQTVHMQYEPSGRFQVKSCDIVGFCQYWAHGAIGQVLREATDSGDVIVHHYDSLMREQQVMSSQGQGVNTSLRFCAGQAASVYKGIPVVETVSCTVFPNAVYAKVIEPLTGPPSYQYFDKQGRRLGATQQLRNEDVMITEATTYDKFGKPATTSLPHAVTEPAVTMNYGKDEFGRIVSVSNSLFTKRKIEIQHSGANITFTNPLGRQHKHVTNAEDLVVEVVDEVQKRIRFWYDPDGNLLAVQGNIHNDNAGWLLRASYDEGGHKRSLLHPDKGLYRYGHDSRGRLIWQVDSNGNNVTFEWDVLGRAVATHTIEGSHYYEYSKQFPDKLVTEYSTVDPLDYRVYYTYDLKGLLTRVDKSFKMSQMDPLAENKTAGCLYNYTLQYDYDAADRLTRITYPTGFFITLLYDANSRVTEIADMMGNLQWKALSFDSNGHVTKELRGNELITEYDYDPLSHSLLGLHTYRNGSTVRKVQDLSYTLDAAENVIRRADNLKGLGETFTYDSLNRVTKSTVQGPGTSFSQEFRYDANSNLIYKTGVGEFHYSLEHPHAVKYVSDPASNSSQPLYEFDYDANGNRVSGNGTLIRYSSMNKPVNITRGPFTTLFDYTLTGKLLVRRDLVWLYIPQEGNSSNITLHTYRTTVYVDDLYQEETTRDPILKPSTVQKHYVQSYAVMVRVINGTVKVFNDSNGNITDIQGAYDELYVTYPYTDIKGSMALTTDQYGRTLQEYSFDVFGSPRSSTTWQPLKRRDNSVQSGEFLFLDEAETLLSQYQHRDQEGYDGHQQLLDTGGDLVHMGGRLYDSIHCSFVTPDPTNDDQYSLVSYNSYAYGRFNPLSGSDPSGYSWLGDIFKSIGHFFAHIVEDIVHFIVHIVDDIVSILRKFPILDELITIALDLTGNFWIEFAWNIIEERIRGESWGDILKDGLINLATHAMGSIAKDATGVEKYLVDAAKGGLQALSHGGNVFKGMIMGVVGDVEKDVAGLIDKGPSNYFILSYNNVPYLKFDLNELAKKAIDGAIDSAAKDAINGDFSDILKDTLHGAWNGFKNDFVQQWDKQKKQFEHKVLSNLNKWITKKVPLIGKLEKDYEKVKKFFGGSKKPQHDSQATTDARTDVDRTTFTRARYFTLGFNSHTHSLYFEMKGSADFFYYHRSQLMYLQIHIHAEAYKTWMWQL